ncbi:vWFA domain containing protein [uncultured Caudovirales phage]|uniref:VWFA domain containing protein n=1 Tax=uncultured Caudovirales phage TaxID=2100421 RepID=A0A6J5M9U9_9CAUD|nr:vWFA domain containing protein [uncultured Caudovirales phage]
MAKKNKPLSVYVALDRSGSMAGERWTHAIDSINEYINGLKKEKIEGTVSIVAFDYGQSMRLVDLVTDQSIAYFEPLTKECAQPSGMTPLFDAAANVMNRAIENNAERTVVVIMTDGEENSSKEYNQKKIKDKVESLTAKKWEVLFLGANFDVTSYTAGSGLAMTKMRNVDFSNQMQRTAMYADLTKSTAAYATVGAAIDLSVDVKVKAQ